MPANRTGSDEKEGLNMDSIARRSTAFILGCALTLLVVNAGVAADPSVPPSTPIGSGPSRAIMQEDPTLPAYTLYHPAQLGMSKLPLVVWGNGGCVNNGASFRWFLSDIASYGYLIIALGPMGDSRSPMPAPMAPLAASNATIAGTMKLPPPATHSPQLLHAIDWAIAENARPGSAYYQHLDTHAIAVMGQSCGGVQAIEVSADPRIRTSMIFNSGLFPQPTGMAGGKELTKADLGSLHAPIAYVSGDDEDIAFVNANDDFERIQGVGALRAYGRGVTHGGTYSSRNGGEFSGVAVAWLNWQLKGDAKGRLLFVGADCGLCVNPHWVVRSKNLR